MYIYYIAHTNMWCWVHWKGNCLFDLYFQYRTFRFTVGALHSMSSSSMNLLHSEWVLLILKFV